MNHVLREPGAWVGRDVRVRGRIVPIFEEGYFLYATAKMRLRLTLPDWGEPPVGAGDCMEVPVDVEGTIRFQENGKDSWVFLDASAISNAPDSEAPESNTPNSNAPD
jgi:hypothetical protein